MCNSFKELFRYLSEFWKDMIGLHNFAGSRWRMRVCHSCGRVCAWVWVRVNGWMGVVVGNWGSGGGNGGQGTFGGKELSMTRQSLHSTYALSWTDACGD